jgi:predicted  nucleic acid-binding Zn-ribbon protein
MSERDGATARVTVERIGGIDETAVDLRPGVAALVGRNATNRTSLLQSIAAVCGAPTADLKGDADEGGVTLQVGGETYTRTLERDGGTVSTSGETMLGDAHTAELFAFLLGSNPVRRAVTLGEGLRDLIMAPIDTEAIEAEIARLRTERGEIDAELDRIDELEAELPAAVERCERFEAEIEETRAELADKREELAAADAAIGGERGGAELDAKLEELNDTQRELAEVRSQISIEESAVDEFRAEIEEFEAERAELSDAPPETIEELDRQIEFVRDQKRDAEASMNDLQRIIQFNDEMLDGANIELLEDRVADDGSGAVTDELVGGARVVCWTCGSEVRQDAVESTLDLLRRVRQDELEKANRLEDRIAELEAEHDRLRRQRQRRERVDGRIASLREELGESERRIERLGDRADDLAGEIEAIEAEIQRLEDRSYDGLLDLQERVNELEFALEDLREERADAQAEREHIESRLDERADLAAERVAIQEAIVEQRTRIERTEDEAVEQFNAQMADLLDRLEYDNVERIWLEPQEADDGGGGREFALHVVRSADDGTTYEDAIDHLSESEREVTGVVFALAGYLAHDVYERVPFLLLDSLEAIDAGRIATLVEYVSDYAEYVVVALLPADARALDDDHDRVTDI